MDSIEKKIKGSLAGLRTSRSAARAGSITKSSAARHPVRRVSDSMRGRPLTGVRRVMHAALLAAYIAMVSQTCAMAQDVNLGPADTSSPRATFRSFIDSCNDIYRRTRENRYLDRTSPHLRPLAERVLDCLDTSELPEYEKEEYAAEVAVCLKEILDRVELPSPEEIPDTDLLLSWRIPDTRITIGKVEDGPRRHEYLFTPGTVARAIEYYESVKFLDYRTTGEETSKDFHRWYVSAPASPSIGAVVDRLPIWMRDRRGGVAIWKWTGLSLSVLVALFLMGAAYRIHESLADRYNDKRPWLYGLTIAIPVIAALIPLALRNFAYEYLTLRGTALYVLSFIANLTTLLVFLFVVFAAGNRIAAFILTSPRINPKGLDAQFIRIVCRLLSIVVAVIIFLEGGQRLGIPVSTLLASAGVGGLAVALSAQDMVKSLFGTIMLLMDKPFRVGERIIFGKYDGVVEDIGLRSTRLRLLTGHQATIPNDELARSDIENVGRRQFIRRSAMLELPAGTPVAKVNQALEIVGTVLRDHEGKHDDYPPRVFLRDLKEASIGIMFMYWYHPPEYWAFLAFSEHVNLQIMEQLEDQHIPFAAPALTVQMSDQDRRMVE